MIILLIIFFTLRVNTKFASIEFEADGGKNNLICFCNTKYEVISLEKTDNRRINPKERVETKSNENINIPKINDAPVPQIQGNMQPSDNQKNPT